MSEPATASVLEIVHVGHPALATRCPEATVFGSELEQLAADMHATMRTADGVGLAANQVGLLVRMFVFDCPDADDNRHRGVIVNPALTLPHPSDRQLDDDLEGCLSVPGTYQMLARPSTATVTGVDTYGAPVSITGTGLLARCLQHEVDHLDGRLYLDRLTARQRRRALAEHASALGGERG